jgi:hypothetical protein
MPSKRFPNYCAGAYPGARNSPSCKDVLAACQYDPDPFWRHFMAGAIGIVLFIVVVSIIAFAMLFAD